MFLILYYMHEKPVLKENFIDENGKFDFEDYWLEKSKLQVIYFVTFAGIFSVIHSFIGGF